MSLLNLKAQMADAFKNILYYQKVFSDPSEIYSTKYFNEIAFTIKLTDLYQVQSSIPYQGNLQPVLFKIVNEDILAQSKAKQYVLQIWDQYYDLQYENQFLGIPTCQAICGNNFFYVPSPEDEESNLIHVVVSLNDEDEQGVVLIKGILEKGDKIEYIAYNEQTEILFYIADQSLNYFELPKENLVKDSEIITIEQEEIKKISLKDQKVHAMYTSTPYKKAGQQNTTATPGEKPIEKLDVYDVYIVFETTDNQLDFNKIYVGEDYNDGYEFAQAAEIVPRERSENYQINDHISTFDYLHFEGHCFAVALRESGQFDLYFDSIRTDSPPEKYAHAIAVNSQGIFIKMKSNDKVENEQVYQIDTKDLKAEFYTAYPLPKESFNFDDVKINKASQAKLYSNIQIQQTEESSFVRVSHRKFVSTYDLVKQHWDGHQAFNTSVKKLFRTYRKYKETFIQCSAAILESGLIQYFDKKEEQEDLTLQVEGDIVQIDVDQQSNKYLFLVINDKETGKPKFQVLYNEEFYNIEVAGLNDETEIVFIHNPKKEPLILIQNAWDAFTINRVVKAKKGVEEKEDEDDYYDEEDDYGEEEKLEKDINTKWEFTLEIVKNFKKSRQRVAKETGWVFNAACFNIEEDLILIDSENLYIVDMKEETVKTIENQDIQGIQYFGPTEIYAICRDSAKYPTGLRLYNFQEIAKTKECKVIPVKRFPVGAQGDLEFNSDICRVGFIISLTDLVLTPLLHRNNVRFFGMNDTQTYLAYKVLKDKMVTLSKNNTLQLWNILQGKLQETHQLSSLDLSKFENHSSLKKDRVVLYSINDETDEEATAFYQPWQIETRVKNQKPFSLAQEQKIKHWKVIEIIDESNVKQHVSFLYPKYSDLQQFYFSQNFEKMIELLENNRVFLYTASEETKRGLGVTTKWVIQKKIDNFRDDFLIDINYLSFYSPNFDHYLDVKEDDEDYYFIIKDTITDQEIATIPDNIMEYNKEEKKKQTALARFQWLDDKTFKIASKFGTEKIIDYSDANNIVTLKSNNIPFFGEESYTYKDENGNSVLGLYYVTGPKFDAGDTFARLKRKLQTYYSCYYLENKREPFELYQDLYTVDSYSFDYADLSYTLVHWNIVEGLLNKEFELKDLDKQVVENLLFNILPGGENLLTSLMIGEKKELVEDILKFSHPEVDGKLTMKYYTPVLPNFQNQTFVHLILESGDKKLLNLTLSNLALYEFAHHSKQIKDIIPKIIATNVDSLFPYFESRLLQDEEIKGAYWYDLTEDFVGAIDVEIGNNDPQIDKKLEELGGKDEVISGKKYIDVPQIYHFEDDHFQPFFDTLASAENYQIFKLAYIQKIIDFNYPLVKKFTVIKLFIPFILFLGLFVFYSNFIFPDRKNQKFWDTSFLIALAVSATYFIANEVKQMIRDPLEYLMSIWNYVDIIPTLGIYTLCLLSFVDFIATSSPVITGNLRAVTAFFMWMKFLYFLRLFKKTSYLIHLIIQVLADMRYFLLILFIPIVAFGDAFLSISQQNDKEEHQFVQNLFEGIAYAYRMVLGDFDTAEGFGDESLWFMWILFFICTIFGAIVMLNLLVAIISETFNTVNGNADQAAYQVMASLIAENNYLIPKSVRESYAIRDGYLVTIYDLNEAESQDGDAVQKKLGELRTELDTHFKEMKAIKESVEVKNKASTETSKQILANLADLTKMVKHLEKNKEAEEEEKAEEKDEENVGENAGADANEK